MANWSKNKVEPSQINKGKEYTKDDNVSVEELNSIVNNSFNAQANAEEALRLAETAHDQNHIEFTIDDNNVLTIKLINSKDKILSEQSVDLPLEDYAQKTSLLNKVEYKGETTLENVNYLVTKVGDLVYLTDEKKYYLCVEYSQVDGKLNRKYYTIAAESGNLDIDLSKYLETTTFEKLVNNETKISTPSGGGSIGRESEASQGFAGGWKAKTKNGEALVDAIQLGTGTNASSKTLQVYDDNIYDANTHTGKFQKVSLNGKDLGKVIEDLEKDVANVVVDSELSETSTNPVQNAIVTNALNNIIVEVGNKPDKWDVGHTIEAILDDDNTLILSLKNNLGEEISKQYIVLTKKGLATENFVNSSISTATETFRVTYLDERELPTTGRDLNDYAFVKTTDEVGNTIFKRYKFDGLVWKYEYDLNNSSFTQEQWDAINSGVDSALIERIEDLLFDNSISYNDLLNKPFKFAGEIQIRSSYSETLDNVEGLKNLEIKFGSNENLWLAIITKVTTYGSTSDLYYIKGEQALTNYYQTLVNLRTNEIYKRSKTTTTDWTTFEKTSYLTTEGTAAKAISDKNGNDIVETYATKGEIPDVSNLTTRVGNVETNITNLQNDKVDKVSGKGLSTNDYTTTEKNKLAGIATGAEVNVQSDWNVTDSSSDAYIKNKPTIPDVSGFAKTTSSNTFTQENTFTSNSYAPTWVDIASGIGKSSKFTRGAFMQMITGQILLPNAAHSDDTRGYNTEKDILKFQTMTASSGQPVVTTIAKLSKDAITAPIYKCDDTKAAFKFSDNNEVNFGSNGDTLYIGYNSTRISADNGKVSKYRFCNSTGSDGTNKGILYCDNVYVNAGKEQVLKSSDVSKLKYKHSINIVASIYRIWLEIICDVSTEFTIVEFSKWLYANGYTETNNLASGKWLACGGGSRSTYQPNIHAIACNGSNGSNVFSIIVVGETGTNAATANVTNLYDRVTQII